MPGVGPAPLMPPAVAAVSWLKAVSFRLSSAPLQLLNDRVELVHAGLNKAAYGRPEENSMTLLRVQWERTARPVPEPVSFTWSGRYTAAKVSLSSSSNSVVAWVLLNM